MKAPNTFAVLWRTFRKYRWHIAVLVVLGFVSAILEGIGINAAIPLLGFLIGDGAAPTDAISHVLQEVAQFAHIPFTFTTLLYLILGLFVLRACSTVLFGYIRGWITADFFYEESRDLLSRMLRASWPFFVGTKTGTIQNTLVRDVQNTSTLLTSIGQIIESFSGFLMYLLVALNIQPTTTLFTFVGGAVLLVIIRPILRRIQRAADAVQYTEKDIAQTLSEQVAGMKSIKAAAMEPELFASTDAHMRLRLRGQVRIALMKAVSSALFQPFTLFFIVVAFWVSYHSPDFSLISFGATLYLIQKIFTYLESGQSGLHVVSELSPYASSIGRFKALLDKEAEPRPGMGKPFVFEREMRGEGLALAYQGAPALTGVDFTLRPGETLALIGPSGAGKTSLADIVLRLFSPQEGTLTLDGVKVQEIPLPEWRSNFAYVAQEPFLFNGTIADNIRFFRPAMEGAEIERAAKAANIYDFIQTLPEGFDTNVGDRGITLSGGQRQRIVLARALAGAPKVLVLDEATSALDTDSERLIQDSIRNLHGKVAVLIIAHRLSTVENADEILVLDRGTVVEHGSPEELLKRPDSYFAKHHDHK